MRLLTRRLTAERLTVLCLGGEVGVRSVLGVFTGAAGGSLALVYTGDGILDRTPLGRHTGDFF